MDVSIIIVNYNTRDLLVHCIESIYQHTVSVKFEIIVTDNGSDDGSVEKITELFPDVVIVENHENIGFGAANNRALNVAKGKYILYLNSDTVLLNNAIKFFFDYWEGLESDGNIGAIGANLINKNCKYALSYASFPTSKDEIKKFIKKMILTNIQFVFPNFKKKNKTEIKPFFGEVDYICGADLFLKNNEFARFDESFFLYYEETDLQYRMFKHGLKRILISGPRIVHLEGGSDKKNDSKYSRVSLGNQHKDLSRIIYFNKNISTKTASFLRLLLLIYWTQPFFRKKTIEMRSRLKDIGK